MSRPPGPWDYKALSEIWKLAANAQRRIYSNTKAPKRARVGEMIAALSAMYHCSGDPRFTAAVEAIKEGGFDKANAGTFKARERAEDQLYARRMHYLLARDKTMSIRIAAARVAVEFIVPGATFDAVVKRLARAYRLAKPIFDGQRGSRRVFRGLDKRRGTLNP